MKKAFYLFLFIILVQIPLTKAMDGETEEGNLDGSGRIEVIESSEFFDHSPKAVLKPSEVFIYYPAQNTVIGRFDVESTDFYDSDDGQIALGAHAEKLTSFLETVLTRHQEDLALPETIKALLKKNNDLYYNQGRLEDITVFKDEFKVQNNKTAPEHVRIYFIKNKSKEDFGNITVNIPEENTTDEVSINSSVDVLDHILESIFKISQKEDDILQIKSELPETTKRILNDNNSIYFNLGARHESKQAEQSRSMLEKHARKIIAGSVGLTAITCGALGYYLGHK